MIHGPSVQRPGAAGRTMLFSDRPGVEVSVVKRVRTDDNDTIERQDLAQAGGPRQTRTLPIWSRHREDRIRAQHGLTARRK